MIKTFRYRLYPSNAQTKRLIKTFGLCRFLYNCALEERISYYKKYKKSLSYFSQTKSLPQVKDLFPEFKTIYSQVLQSTLKRADSAYQGFFRRLRAGEKAGFPRFKGNNRFNSILYTQSGFALGKRKGKKSTKWSSLKLSKIGNLSMRMHRNISGNLKTCQVVRTSSGKWFVCLTCDEIPKKSFAKTSKVIGIDLGVKNLIAMSNGNKIANPKHFKKIQIRLRKAQRKLSKMSFKHPRRHASKMHAARLYEKTINQRKDFYHKLSNNLIKRFDKIALEKHNIKSMMKDNWRSLNREIQNAAWGQLVQMILYKAESADKEVVLVNPANTSQMCSDCGKIVKKDLSIRIHKCECGLTIDRDINAAINILHRGLLCQPREGRNGRSETLNFKVSRSLSF